MLRNPRTDVTFISRFPQFKFCMRRNNHQPLCSEYVLGLIMCHSKMEKIQIERQILLVGCWNFSCWILLRKAVLLTVLKNYILMTSASFFIWVTFERWIVIVLDVVTSAINDNELCGCREQAPHPSIMVSVLSVYWLGNHSWTNPNWRLKNCFHPDSLCGVIFEFEPKF